MKFHFFQVINTLCQDYEKYAYGKGLGRADVHLCVQQLACSSAVLSSLVFQPESNSSPR